MSSPIQTIALERLALAAIPVVAVLAILWKWKLNYRGAVHAVLRMLIQLMLIGYVLIFLFEQAGGGIVLGVLALMLLASSWIAMRNLPLPVATLLPKSLAAIATGGGAVLFIVTQGVLNLDPWFTPSYMIPLAGMVFGSAMNSVSLAGERLAAELDRDVSYGEARSVALNASLIPITNSLFAVGLVSLPGMMTGQILSGVSPFVAARYQIMVMCMIFGACGIAAATFLMLVRKDMETR